MKLKPITSLILVFLLPLLVNANTYSKQQLTPPIVNSKATDNNDKLMIKRSKKLTPIVRFTIKKQAAPIIPLPVLSSFLSKDHIINAELVKNAPRILGDSVGSPRFFADDIFYAQGQYSQDKVYGIYRLGEPYHSKTGEILGSALTFIGYATVSNNKNLPTSSLLTAFDLNSSVREARQGDLLLAIPEFESLPAYFMPVAVSENVKGHILKALNHASIIGEWDTVVIDKGKRDHIEVGSMFSILRPGPALLINKANIIYQEDGDVFQQVQEMDLTIPSQRVGQLMVFKVYEKVSIAIVIKAHAVMNANFSIEGLTF